MCVSLVSLDGFHLLLSIYLTANLTPEWSDGSMFHPLSYIYTKTHFCCIETVANNTLNCRDVVYDWLWAKAQLTLNTAFSLTNIHVKLWTHSLLISSTPLLSHAISIYDRPKHVCRVFWCFPGQLLNLGDLSKVQITLIKPLLYLNSIFFLIRKQCFINPQNSDFSIVWKICNSK